MLAPLNGLRAFEAVARHESFTRAAQELAVSQSAVSHQIRNLEGFLRTRLFERSGLTLALTQEGQTLYAGLRQAFALIRQSVADVQAEVEASPLGISLKPHFALKWLAPRLARFWQVNPGLDLRFFHTNQPADFADPQVHVSIEWRHGEAAGPECILLVEGALTPACHPALLAGPRALRTPADLGHHTLLHETDDKSWLEWLAKAGEPGLDPAHKQFYEDTNVRQQAAIEGQGVALVCPRLAADDLAAGRLACPFDIRLDSYSYYLVVPPNRLDVPNVRKFVNWLMREREADQAP